MAISKKNYVLTRRTVLKGLGAILGLPLLEAMRGFDAYAAPGPKVPVRSAFLYVPNGVHPQAWTPSVQGTNYELSEILAPLKAVKSDMLVLTELEHKLTDKGDGHYFKGAAWLTGTTITKTTGEGMSVNGVSLDQLMAEKMNTRLPSIELGTEPVRTGVDNNVMITQVYGGHISWNTPTTPMPKEINPRLAFDRLFKTDITPVPVKPAAPGAAPEAPPPPPLDDRSIIDLVRQDANGLKDRLGRADQNKLDEFLTAVRDVEKRLNGEATRGAEQAGRIDPLAIQEYSVLGQKIKAYGSGPGKGKFNNGNHTEHVRLMMDIMVLGFWTNFTRVATFMFGNEVSGRNFSFVEGVTGGHHDMSHHENKAEKLEQYKKINIWHSQQLAYMLEKMKAIKEGGATLLDNSMILYGSGMRDGNAHSMHNVPTILAGKGGGTIASGRHLVYKKGTPLTNVHRSMLLRMGVSGPTTEKISDSTGELDGLLDAAFEGTGKLAPPKAPVAPPAAK